MLSFEILPREKLNLDILGTNAEKRERGKRGTILIKFRNYTMQYVVIMHNLLMPSLHLLFVASIDKRVDFLLIDEYIETQKVRFI